jgi:hypothetical protein
MQAMPPQPAHAPAPQKNTRLQAAHGLADGLVDHAHLLADLLDLLQRGVDVLDLHLLRVARRG